MHIDDRKSIKHINFTWYHRIPQKPCKERQLQVCLARCVVHLKMTDQVHLQKREQQKTKLVYVCISVWNFSYFAVTSHHWHQPSPIHHLLHCYESLQDTTAPDSSRNSLKAVGELLSQQTVLLDCYSMLQGCTLLSVKVILFSQWFTN